MADNQKIWTIMVKKNQEVDVEQTKYNDLSSGLLYWACQCTVKANSMEELPAIARKIFGNDYYISASSLITGNS